MDQNKPIAKICANGMIKFYNHDGSRNKNHSLGFYNPKNLKDLKENYNVIY